MITATQQLESYLESFSEFEKLAAGHALPWLRKLRQDAFARFCEVGFPTTHDEDWRFTRTRVDRQRLVTEMEAPLWPRTLQTKTGAALQNRLVKKRTQTSWRSSLKDCAMR